MLERERPPLADLKDQLGGVAADLREMLSLRWELARLELEADVRSARRLAVALAVAGVMALSAVPLALSGIAELLDGRLGIGRAGWLGLFSLGLAAGALGIGILAYRAFRRRFVGLAETLEECREDLVWLREWLGK